MKQTVLVFVLIVSGVTAGKAKAPSRTEARPLVFSSIQADAGTTGAHFSGGPTCLPHEPCGSGS
jgi:hypothetical protein